MSTKLNEKFLEKYLNSHAPTGHEVEMGGQKEWVKYIKPFVKEFHYDKYGTAYGVTGNLDSEFKVVIEAHADEISWRVKYIRPDGYIRVERNGGSDTLIAPSKRVKIWTRTGKEILGVFGYPPIHDHKRNTKADLETIFLDVGAKDKQAVLDMDIEVGNVLAFEDKFAKLGEDFYTGRALDNRIGGFAIAEVARKLSEKNVELPFKLFVVNSVQEEVGLFGAKMITETIKPDIAIITDVCHETHSPAYNPERQGDFKAGKGGVIDKAPAVHNILYDMIRKVVDDKKIPHQLSVSARQTGTDTDAFAFSNGGVPSALISFPLKYMHTTNETVHKDDVISVIRTIYHLVKSIEDGQSMKYETYY